MYSNRIELFFFYAKILFSSLLYRLLPPFLPDFVWTGTVSTSTGASFVTYLLNNCNNSNVDRLPALNLIFLISAVSMRTLKSILLIGWIVLKMKCLSSIWLPCTSGISSNIKLGSLRLHITSVLIMHLGLDSTDLGVVNWYRKSLHMKRKRRVLFTFISSNCYSY